MRGLVVHPAGEQDQDGAKLVLELLKEPVRHLQRVWADSGYQRALEVSVAREIE